TAGSARGAVAGAAGGRRGGTDAAADAAAPGRRRAHHSGAQRRAAVAGLSARQRRLDAAAGARAGGGGLMPGRLLIILLGAIGDVVCGMPLAQRLRAGWARTRIMWAVEPAAAPLLEGHPAVDEVIVFRRGGGIPALIEMNHKLRESRTDLVLDL